MMAPGGKHRFRSVPTRETVSRDDARKIVAPKVSAFDCNESNRCASAELIGRSGAAIATLISMYVPAG